MDNPLLRPLLGTFPTLDQRVPPGHSELFPTPLLTESKYSHVREAQRSIRLSRGMCVPPIQMHYDVAPIPENFLGYASPSRLPSIYDLEISERLIALHQRDTRVCVFDVTRVLHESVGLRVPNNVQGRLLTSRALVAFFRAAALVPYPVIVVGALDPAVCGAVSSMVRVLCVAVADDQLLLQQLTRQATEFVAPGTNDELPFRAAYASFNSAVRDAAVNGFDCLVVSAHGAGASTYVASLRGDMFGVVNVATFL